MEITETTLNDAEKENTKICIIPVKISAKELDILTTRQHDHVKIWRAPAQVD